MIEEYLIEKVERTSCRIQVLRTGSQDYSWSQFSALATGLSQNPCSLPLAHNRRVGDNRSTKLLNEQKSNLHFYRHIINGPDPQP